MLTCFLDPSATSGTKRATTKTGMYKEHEHRNSLCVILLERGTVYHTLYHDMVMVIHVIDAGQYSNHIGRCLRATARHLLAHPATSTCLHVHARTLTHKALTTHHTHVTHMTAAKSSGAGTNHKGYAELVIAAIHANHHGTKGATRAVGAAMHFQHV